MGDGLHAYHALDGRMALIILKLEIIIFERENILDAGIDAHLGQMVWSAGQLKVHLIEVIEVDVRIAYGMHKITQLIAANLRHHHGEQRV